MKRLALIFTCAFAVQASAAQFNWCPSEYRRIVSMQPVPVLSYQDTWVSQPYTGQVFYQQPNYVYRQQTTRPQLMVVPRQRQRYFGNFDCPTCRR